MGNAFQSYLKSINNIEPLQSVLDGIGTSVSGDGITGTSDEMPKVVAASVLKMKPGDIGLFSFQGRVDLIFLEIKVTQPEAMSD